MVCTTREIVAQNRQVGLGTLCTAWTVASELEEGFACTLFFLPWTDRTWLLCTQPGLGPLCTQPYPVLTKNSSYGGSESFTAYYPTGHDAAFVLVINKTLSFFSWRQCRLHCLLPCRTRPCIYISHQ